MERIKSNGLNEKEVLASREKHGLNLLTPPKQTPWWKLYLEKFEDPIIVILLFATMISLIFGFIHGEYTESVGIICAVLLATGVGFWQEYSAKKKFDAMKSDKDYEMVKVRRDGVVVEITKDQMVVGDVAILAAGDEIPADIELYSATDMKVAEAAMTGESVAVDKHPTLLSLEPHAWKLCILEYWQSCNKTFSWFMFFSSLIHLYRINKQTSEATQYPRKLSVAVSVIFQSKPAPDSYLHPAQSLHS